MGTFEMLLQIVSGGSDVALVAIAFAIWKIERRVYRLETLIIQREIEHA